MTCRVVIVAFLWAMASSAGLVAWTAPGSASPLQQFPTDQADGSCSFTLSAPQLVHLPGGATAVTASLVASSCTGTAQAQATTVCLAPAAGAGQCAHAVGWEPAQAYLYASNPTGTFTATGKGCWRIAGETDTSCSGQGPVSAEI
jgi:hypothetical protein